MFMLHCYRIMSVSLRPCGKCKSISVHSKTTCNKCKAYLNGLAQLAEDKAQQKRDVADEKVNAAKNCEKTFNVRMYTCSYLLGAIREETATFESQMDLYAIKTRLREVSQIYIFDKEIENLSGDVQFVTFGPKNDQYGRSTCLEIRSM